MKIELKIKLISLGLEAQAIRRIERKLKSKPGYKVDGSNTRKAFKSIQDHRRMTIREEARASHLAYGFLRGRDYAVMEEKAYTQPNWKRVENIAQRFAGLDPRDFAQRFEHWKQMAKEQGRFLHNEPRKVRVRPSNHAPAQG